MDRIEKPRGLIRYTSERELSGSRTRVARLRTAVYSVLLLGVLSAFTVVLSSRSDFDINVGRVAGEPFTVLPDGRVANRLRFRVRNQTERSASFEISVLEPAQAELQLVGASPVSLEPGEMKRIETWVLVPRADFGDDEMEGHFQLAFSDGDREEVSFTLLGPSN
jgi:polyferredoxin